jgi:uncharacterized membrane protein
VTTPSLEIPRRELAFLEERGGFRLILKRNCSISPAGLLGVFVALACVALGIGAGFAAVGLWLVLPFAGLEVLLLGAAFVLHARGAADYEKIELQAGRLTVEVAEAQRKARYELEARRARVCLEKEEGYGARVLLRGAQEELEIGRHLDAESRVRFAAELVKRLSSSQGLQV